MSDTSPETVVEQFKLDLQLEEQAIPRLNAAIAVCLQSHDTGTRTLLEQILTAEEEHKDWLEAQLHLIGVVGEAAYLAEQIVP